MTTPVEDLLAALPTPVRERVRPVGGSLNTGGRFVLCWLRQAVRDHDNPALDTTLHAASALGVPAFVYQGLDARHPYASDRLHRFQLQGARDLASGLARRGVGYALHVDRPGHQGPHLRTLASSAVLVVTEDVPVEPLHRWTASLAERPGTAVWAVDSHCVLPMNAVRGVHDRAFRFRQATDAARREAVRAGWQDAPSPAGPWCPPNLPFESVDPCTADHAALVASCDIDHTIGPVSDTPGGTVAGMARWTAFRDRGLRRYARDRNDAARDGVSQMSAYLHFGHVSPFRLAADALAVGGEGADKFLDELLTWRELSWHWARTHVDPGWDDLPVWARATLDAHHAAGVEGDRSWEDLARGRSGDPLWDLAQDSLRIHGALHNNLRMTWGKALSRWAADPRRALRLAIDLNHRFALDGRDPASHLGILWCFGGFDRPFPPARPGLGEVRPRDTASHAARVDMDALAARVRRPRRAFPVRTVVVGAGLAGLACARTLLDHGEDVVVVDKGRGLGGRTASRRGDGIAWDHGASRLDLDDPRLVRWLASWRRDGVVTRWEGTAAPWSGGCLGPAEPDAAWVAVGAGNALARHLARELDVRRGVEVRAVVRDGAGYALLDAEGRPVAHADRVVVTAPAPQALSLVQDVQPGLASALAGVAYTPVLVALVDGAGPDVGGVRFADHPLLREARRIDHLPGRAGRPAWVLRASEPWAAAHVDTPVDAVGDALAAAWTEAVGAFVRGVTGHRWRFGQPAAPVAAGHLEYGAPDLLVAGDAFAGGGAGGALLSGFSAAGRLLGT